MDAGKTLQSLKCVKENLSDLEIGIEELVNDLDELRGRKEGDRCKRKK